MDMIQEKMEGKKDGGKRDTVSPLVKQTQSLQEQKKARMHNRTENTNMHTSCVNKHIKGT